MFSIILRKRTISLKPVNSSLNCIALRPVTHGQGSLKWCLHHFHSKNFCNEMNSFSPRDVHAHKFYSKDETQNTADQVAELLRTMYYNVNNFQRVKFEDAERMLNFMQNGLVTEHDKYGLLLLEWCGCLMPDTSTSSRLLLAHSVWRTLKSNGIKFSSKHYNILLKCYAANQYNVSVPKFIESMGPVEPDKTTFDCLLECTCINGDIEQATLVLQMMKKRNISVSETTFNSLILGHARAGDIKSSLFTLDTMKAANLVPSANTYTAVMQSYADVGDIEAIKNTYNEATSKNIILNDFQAMDIYRILAIRKHQHCLTEFLALLPEDLKKLTSSAYNTILELVHLKFEAAALLLVMSVSTKMDYKSTDHPFSFFVHEMCKANAEPATIINICNQLEKQDIFPRALYKAAESSFKLARSEIILPVFRAMVNKGIALRPHYFWPILRQRTSEGEKGILTTLKEMQSLGLTPDFHTLLDYIIPMISTNDPEATVQKLQACGVTVHQSLTPIAATLILNGKLQSLLQICEIYPTKVDFEKLLQPLVKAFLVKKPVADVVHLLKAFSKNATTDLAGQFVLELLVIKGKKYRIEDIMNLLKSFKQEGIFISSFAADVLSQYLKNGETNSKLFNKARTLVESVTQPDLHITSAETAAIHIPHPRDMNMEELECHLVELKSKNMNTRGVLRRLMQLHVQKGNMKRVLELKKELEDAGFEFSLGMKASLFSMYIHLKELNSAEKCLGEIMQESPDFLIDEHKIIDYATLLVKEKQYKAAVAVLERRAVSGKISGGESVSRNCWQLLNTIAMQGEPEKVKHMFHLLRTLGFCAVSNSLLGPSVRAYLIQGDTEGAVKEYQRCTAEFRKTPLQQELLTYLVKNDIDSPRSHQFLDDVLVASSSIHGESSTFAAYAVALAENGRKKELNIFVRGKGSCVENAVLLNRARKLAKEGKIVPLSILTEACANLPNFDTSLFYTLMLHIYDTRGDYEGALQLWTEMQEKSIQPSEQFLESLASILRSYNKIVPFTSSNNKS